MATTVAQHQVSAFATPVNGGALDANVVRGNDNSLRTAYVAHDADTGIHVQSSALAARPAAGTDGRKWMTVDAGIVRLWYDTGSTWVEAAYSALTSAVRTETGNYTITAADDYILANASSGTQTITLPTAVGLTGRQFTIKRLTASGAATITIATTGGQTIDGLSTLTLPNRYDAVTVLSTGSAWLIISEVSSNLILEA